MYIVAVSMFAALRQIHKRRAGAHWRCVATFKETNGDVGDTEKV